MSSAIFGISSSSGLNYQAKSNTITLLTGLTPNVDIGSIFIPSSITKYIIRGVFIRSITAAGTLAAATVNIRTAASGAGSSILAGGTPVALATLTAIDLVNNITPVLTTVLTTPTIYIYQTIGSANVGTVLCVLDLIDLS